MTKQEAKFSGVAASIVGLLPTRYRSKVGLAAALVGVVVSAVALESADHPEVAIVIQALTALGFVEKPSE
ncbi:DUF7439 family protein [Streptodolium elevatio]|uniref:Uncharacterized protein n=1 Tax=Streptodolium elevatio TaxID=3157996 RepID=A0ABV3DBU4_9ACTN